MDSIVISLETGSRRGVHDITTQIARFVTGRGDGLASIFVPHATAGVAIMETGSGSEADLMDAVDGLLPREDRYRHRHGSVGHGADHVLPAFISPSVTIPVVAGRLQLGTWQSVVLVDTNEDNPERRVIVSFHSA